MVIKLRRKQLQHICFHLKFRLLGFMLLFVLIKGINDKEHMGQTWSSGYLLTLTVKLGFVFPLKPLLEVHI